MIVDYRKLQRGGHFPLYINGAKVERVSSVRFLGQHLTDDLSCLLHTNKAVRSACQRLFFLRRLRKFGLPPDILTNFYRCTTESILMACITVWYGSCTAYDRKALKRVVRTAESIIGRKLPDLQDISRSRCLRTSTSPAARRKIQKIRLDCSHPAHGLFTMRPQHPGQNKPASEQYLPTSHQVPEQDWTEVTNFLQSPSLQTSKLHVSFRSAQEHYGDGSRQNALAMNVPKEKCSKGVVPDQNFLLDNDVNEVKAAMNGPARVYKGQQLIGAKPKRIPNTRSNYHSEYLLLINSNPSPTSTDDHLMKKLLDRDPDGCVVFYTFNSPCVKTCSTPNKPYSIIPALENFRNHNGPKAFVFGQAWKRDINTTQWEANIREVDSRVPLYRCDNTGCYLCVQENQPIHNKCMSN
ncbi:hypothetical protein NFI96_005710 [Prochilodus magdalenae]|nr:hypothetical protein NFI96_005710 [Prochilodus magdalenae]